MEDKVVITSSSIEAGIDCWDLCSGAEYICYRSCASPPHDLPQVEVKSFPVETINPLACNNDGSYIIGRGVFWSYLLVGGCNG
ncbi:unnamed protein product [Lactuca virosa]|uniref:Uncharacterized protein n=1 Tax=Lactuca virosa TaxID=75947 RepID=A0AAU9MCI1_9ASTR|nr:unnamed protein product [Lactuca virosa]